MKLSPKGIAEKAKEVTNLNGFISGCVVYSNHRIQVPSMLLSPTLKLQIQENPFIHFIINVEQITWHYTPVGPLNQGLNLLSLTNIMFHPIGFFS